MHLYTLILSELNIFLKMYSTKSKVNLTHTTYVEYKMMILFMCGAYWFRRIYVSRKTLLDYTNLFSLTYYKKNDKIIYKYFKDKYAKYWVKF